MPKTRTKLYQETIASLWKRYYYERLGLSQEGIANEESQFRLTKFLENLGQVALVGLLNHISKDKLLFNDCDFEPATLFLALRVGILSRERIRSKLHTKTSVKFLHTSIQDYCSAVYMANSQVMNTDKFPQYVVGLLYPTYIPFNILCRTFEVLIFCAGCNSEIVKLIAMGVVTTENFMQTNEGRRLLTEGNFLDYHQMEILQRSPNTDVTHEALPFYESVLKREKFRYLTVNLLFILAFEAQLTHEECDKLVQILLKSNRPLGLQWLWRHVQYHLNLLKPITDTNFGLLFSSLSCIHCIDTIEFPRFYGVLTSMLMYAKQLTFIELNLKFLNAPYQISNLSEMFDALAHLKYLKYLHLLNSSTQVKVDITNTFHKICHLKLRDLDLVNITATVTSLTVFLSSNKTLEWLTIVNPFDSVTYDTFSMMRAISSIQTLSSLVLGYLNIGRTVKCLKPIIPKLEELSLFHPCLAEEDLNELISYFDNAKALKELRVVGNFLGTAVGSLADQLKHMVNLKVLNLMNTSLGNHEAKILADGIKMTSSLCKLDLKMNPGIGFGGRQAIVNLRTLPQFKQLDIELDPISTTMQQLGIHEQIQESNTPALPNCHRCMSHVYNSVKCALCVREGRGKDVKGESRRVQKSLLREVVQVSLLPECHRCMSQLYNGVKCALCTMEGRATDD